MIWLLLPVAVASGVGFWLYRTQKKIANESKLKRRAKSKLPQINDYKGNVVVPGKAACEAVKRINETRFLEAETPPLPLVGCDAASCTCRYEHFEYRRDPSHDRRNKHSLMSSLHEHSGEIEKREQNDQRRGTKK